jgi:hypothetical protein
MSKVAMDRLTLSPFAWWLEVRMEDGVWESEGQFHTRDDVVRYAMQGGDGPWRVSRLYAADPEPIE